MLEITLKPWYYECGDHCCSEYGLTVTVDGKKVTEHGDQNFMLLSAVLNHLGHDVKIIGLDEEGEEAWENVSYESDAT